MANVHNKEICFVYVDDIETYNNAQKEDGYIYFVKNYGIFIGNRKVSNYINRVSQLFNDENYISVDDAMALIKDAVSNLVEASPEMLDTLYELGLALGQDPNFAATITEALSNVDVTLQQKVDKVDGKQLSTEDYTTEEKVKLARLENYNDTSISNRVTVLETKHYFDNNDELDPTVPDYVKNITEQNIDDWNDAGEKVDQLKNVAFSDNYNDLNNTPQNLSDFNDDTSLNYRVETLEGKVDIIESKPAYNITDENIDDWNSKSASVDNLKRIAFTANYNDLINTPQNLSDFIDDTSLNYRVETLENKVNIIENKPAYNITDENIDDWNDAGEKVDQLKDVAFTANYNDLINIPQDLSDFNDDTSLNYRVETLENKVETLEDKVDIIEDKPAYNITDENINDWNDAGQRVDQLKTVAFTSSYNDLIDTPQDLSDFNDDTSLNYRVETLEDNVDTIESKVDIIENKPAYNITDENIDDWNDAGQRVDQLKEIAFTSSYDDLIDTPQDLSDFNDDTSLNYRVGIIEDKPAYNITDENIEYWNTKQNNIQDLEVIRAGSAAGLSALQIEEDPTVPQHVKDITILDISNWNAKSASVDNLHPVAFSGNYNHLNNTPYIPEKISDLTNDNFTVSDPSYVHTDNNYTIQEKQKLESLYNYNDTELDNRISILELKEEEDPIFMTHIASHITDASVNYWNEKQTYISDLETIREGAALGATALQKHQNLDLLADGAEYDSISHMIYLKHGNNRLDNPINAADFIKDGMVSDVSIHKGTGDNIQLDCLIISFNTDAGHDNIEIPINKIFNPNNYYTKDDIENKQYLQAETDPIFNAHITSHITDGSINYWNNKQDAISNSSFEYWNNKQEFIQDLETIRSGAAAGATALQNYTETDPTVEQYIKDISTADIDYWNNKQEVIPDVSFNYWNDKQPKIQDTSIDYWNNKQDYIIDLETIRSGAAAGATALQNYTETDPVFESHIAYTITDSSIADWNSKQPKIQDTSIEYWDNKQDIISDLEEIRAGAALGNTALQSHQPIKTINENNIVGEGNISVGTITGITMNNQSKGNSGIIDLGTVITEHQPIMTINGNTIVGEGNVDISGLPDVSTNDNNKILMVVNGEWQMVMPVFVYTGQESPNNILGNNGDIFLQS